MKKSILVLLLLMPSFLLAKTISYEMKGKIGAFERQYYAYLYIKKNVVEKVKIQNGNFGFSGKIDIGENLYIVATLFIDERDDISAQEITMLKKNFSVLSRKENYIQLVLEDMDFYITNPIKVNTITFLKGGQLSKANIESEIYIKNNNMLGFFKKYPNSPISATMLRIMIVMRSMPWRKEERMIKYPVYEAYELLSDSLKSAEYVRKLKLEVDKL